MVEIQEKTKLTYEDFENILNEENKEFIKKVKEYLQKLYYAYKKISTKTWRK